MIRFNESLCGKIVFSVSCIIFGLTSSAEAESAKQKCGVIVPLSGKVAEWGKWLREGIEIAQAESNSAQAEFIYEDDQYLPLNSVTAFRKLTENQKINCLITLGSGSSLAVQELAEQAKITTFSVAISPKVGQDKNYVFRFHIPVSSQVEMLKSEIVRKQYRRIAILTAEHDATLPLTSALIAANVAEVVLTRELSADDTTASILAIQIAKLAPDAVFLNLIPPSQSTIARRLRELGYQGEFFSGPTLDSYDEVLVANGALEGAWFVSADNSRAGEFVTRYREKFNRKPSMVAAWGYQIAKIILATNDGVVPPELVRRVEGFDGIVGTIRWNGRELDLPAGIWRIQGKEILGPSELSQDS